MGEVIIHGCFPEDRHHQPCHSLPVVLAALPQLQWDCVGNTTPWSWPVYLFGLVIVAWREGEGGREGGMKG